MIVIPFLYICACREFFRTSSTFEDSSGRGRLRKGEKGKKEENRVESPLEICFFLEQFGEHFHEIYWWRSTWNILVNFCCLLSRLLSKHPQPTAMRRHLPLTKSTTDWQSRCVRLFSTVYFHTFITSNHLYVRTYSHIECDTTFLLLNPQLTIQVCLTFLICVPPNHLYVRMYSHIECSATFHLLYPSQLTDNPGGSIGFR